MAHITAEEVRARLQTMTEGEVPDDLLAQPSFIPAGDAWLDVILEAAGKEFTVLSANAQKLAKAAEIAFVAHKVIGSAPVRGSKSGPVEIRPVPEADKARLCLRLQEEWTLYLKRIGCSAEEPWWSASFGGAEYDRS